MARYVNCIYQIALEIGSKLIFAGKPRISGGYLYVVDCFSDCFSSLAIRVCWRSRWKSDSRPFKHLTKNFEVESVEYENTYEIHQDVDSGRAGRVAADPQKR